MGVQADRARQVLHGFSQTAGGGEGSPSGNQSVAMIRAHPQRLRVDVDSRLGRRTQKREGRLGVGSAHTSDRPSIPTSWYRQIKAGLIPILYDLAHVAAWKPLQSV